VGQFLHSKNPAIQNVLVEPTESRVLIGHESDLHALVGIGAGIPLPLVEELAPGQPWQVSTRISAAFY
jgi:cysteine synthase